jgi:hypothetical protein
LVEQAAESANQLSTVFRFEFASVQSSTGELDLFIEKGQTVIGYRLSWGGDRLSGRGFSCLSVADTCLDPATSEDLSGLFCESEGVGVCGFCGDLWGFYEVRHEAR